jgi:transcriptional regulator with XRE-family HTH domain
MSTEKPHMEIFERIKYVRKALKLRQADMAKKLGIAVSTYQYYERGQRDVPGWVLEEINTYGVNSRWLLSGRGDPFSRQNVNDDSKVTLNGRDVEQTVSSQSTIDLEYTELVRRFTDKKLAMEVTEHILEIEQLNSAAFKEACSYLKGIATGLKSMVEYDRRKGERRQRNDEYRSPDQERRVAERRKAVGA